MTVGCDLPRLLEGVPNCWYPAGVDDATVSLECGDVVLGVEFSPHVVCALLAVASQSCGTGNRRCQGLHACEETSSHVGRDLLHKLQVSSPPSLRVSRIRVWCCPKRDLDEEKGKEEGGLERIKEESINKFY